MPSASGGSGLMSWKACEPAWRRGWRCTISVSGSTSNLVVLGWLSLICWSGDLNSHQAFKATWLRPFGAHSGILLRPPAAPMLLVGGLLEFLEVHFKLPYPRFEVQKVPRQLLGDVQAGHPSLHSLVGTLWPGRLNFSSCMLFGYLVVVIHDAPFVSNFFTLTALRFPKSTSCTLRGAVNTTLCFGKRQVISKRRVH